MITQNSLYSNHKRNNLLFLNKHGSQWPPTSRRQTYVPRGRYLCFFQPPVAKVESNQSQPQTQYSWCVSNQSLKPSQNSSSQSWLQKVFWGSPLITTPLVDTIRQQRRSSLPDCSKTCCTTSSNTKKQFLHHQAVDTCIFCCSKLDHANDNIAWTNTSTSRPHQHT